MNTSDRYTTPPVSVGRSVHGLITATIVDIW